MFLLLFVYAIAKDPPKQASVITGSSVSATIPGNHTPNETTDRTTQTKQKDDDKPSIIPSLVRKIVSAKLRDPESAKFAWMNAYNDCKFLGAYSGPPVLWSQWTLALSI
jgi:hypothetical protein